MAAFIEITCILKILNFLEILGSDMWYQSMVQILGLNEAQLVSLEQ